MYSLENKNKYSNLFQLEYFYTKFSVLRLIRKFKKVNQKENLNHLIKI